ncbi:hypothetical protein D3C76_1661420 [compost metagenome]
MQFRVFGLVAFHEPAEHVLVFAAEQTPVQLSIFRAQGWKNVLAERNQQHVQLEHAAAAVPKELVEFNLFDHEALQK